MTLLDGKICQEHIDLDCRLPILGPDEVVTRLLELGFATVLGPSQRVAVVEEEVGALRVVCRRQLERSLVVARGGGERVQRQRPVARLPRGPPRRLAELARIQTCYASEANRLHVVV